MHRFGHDSCCEDCGEHIFYAPELCNKEGKRRSRKINETVEIFERYRSRHGGSVSLGAEFMGVNANSLARALSRANARGIKVQYRDDHNTNRRAS